MKKLFDFANNYASDLGLKDLSIIKLGTVSLGILLGLILGKKHTKSATIASTFVLLLSGILTLPTLCKKGYQFMKEEQPEEEGFIMRIVTQDEA